MLDPDPDSEPHESFSQVGEGRVRVRQDSWLLFVIPAEAGIQGRGACGEVRRKADEADNVPYPAEIDYAEFHCRTARRG